MPCPSGFLFVTWQVPVQPLRPTQMVLPPESRPLRAPPRYQGLLRLLPHLCPWSGTVPLISSPFSSSLGPRAWHSVRHRLGHLSEVNKKPEKSGLRAVTGSQLLSPVLPRRQRHPIDSIDRPSAPRKCLGKGSAGPRPPCRLSTSPRPGGAPSINRARWPPRSEGFCGIGVSTGPSPAAETWRGRCSDTGTKADLHVCSAHNPPAALWDNMVSPVTWALE